MVCSAYFSLRNICIADVISRYLGQISRDIVPEDFPEISKLMMKTKCVVQIFGTIQIIAALSQNINI